AALLAFTRESLAACGVPEADAAVAAKAMIEADLTGFDAHGIFRLSAYVATLQSGRVNPKAAIKVVQRAPATALVDGDNGMGHLVMTFAINLAIELARASRVCWCVMRRSIHTGASSALSEVLVVYAYVGSH